VRKELDLAAKEIVHPNRWRTDQRLEGQTILQAAKASGKSIPTLCDLDGLTAGRGLPPLHGGGLRHRPAVSRVHHAHSGRHVGDHQLSARLTRYRRISVELLLSSATTFAPCASPTDIANCNQWPQPWASARCDFLQLPQTLGVDISHPRFVLDHNRCILCTRCVRVCAELEGAHVWEISRAASTPVSSAT
jgi:bidirectional [NiFe] hydrogenase diaphorase subunit